MPYGLIKPLFLVGVGWEGHEEDRRPKPPVLVDLGDAQEKENSESTHRVVFASSLQKIIVIYKITNGYDTSTNHKV